MIPLREFAQHVELVERQARFGCGHEIGFHAQKGQWTDEQKQPELDRLDGVEEADELVATVEVLLDVLVCCGLVHGGCPWVCWYG